MKRTIVSLEVPSSLYYDIEQHACALHLSKSDVIRFALYEYLTKYAPALTPSPPTPLTPSPPTPLTPSPALEGD